MERIILIADEGKVYTNGSTYGVEIYLGNGDSVDNWQEIALEDAQEKWPEDFVTGLSEEEEEGNSL